MPKYMVEHDVVIVYEIEAESGDAAEKKFLDALWDGTVSQFMGDRTTLRHRMVGIIGDDGVLTKFEGVE